MSEFGKISICYNGRVFGVLIFGSKKINSRLNSEMVTDMIKYANSHKKRGEIFKSHDEDECCSSALEIMCLEALRGFMGDAHWCHNVRPSGKSLEYYRSTKREFQSRLGSGMLAYITPDEIKALAGQGAFSVNIQIDFGKKKVYGMQSLFTVYSTKSQMEAGAIESFISGDLRLKQCIESEGCYEKTTEVLEKEDTLIRMLKKMYDGIAFNDTYEVKDYIMRFAPYKYMGFGKYPLYDSLAANLKRGSVISVRMPTHV